MSSLETAQEYLHQLHTMQCETGDEILHLATVAKEWGVKAQTVRSRTFQIRKHGLEPPLITANTVSGLEKRVRYSIDGYAFVRNHCPKCNVRMVTDEEEVWCEKCGYISE